MAKKKSAKKESAAEKAAEKPAGPKLSRRHRETGEISERKRGRPNPEFENGYLNDGGEFVAGDPTKRRGRRRRRGKPVGRPAGRRTQGRPASKGLSDVERIVKAEVDTRLKIARDAAINAFKVALGV